MTNGAARDDTRPSVALVAVCFALWVFATPVVAPAAERYDHVRVTGGEFVSDMSAHVYELRCRDGSRRAAYEYWDLEADPPQFVEICVRGQCRDGDINQATGWACQ